ncbi:MAG: hypothetical protein IT360_05015 [Gemmatimonadaceae bacterium]|nr:hypothetical protein [Gemmatimonadaceae bacterium]
MKRSALADSALVAVMAFVLAAVATALDGWPLPRVFDEFSYLIGAETFAAGRLSNPPHQLPEFFNTIHVLQTPTYTSKYFPGHSLFLALGIVLGGGPRLGQWIAFAFMGGALCWMLRGCVSRRGALAGSAILVLLLADTHWTSGYWGSAAALGGSALMFGAILRVQHDPAPRTAGILGLGVVVLALTRPFEGLAVSLVPALAMLTWCLGGGCETPRRLLRVALPTLLVIGAGAAFLAAHNRATTGNAFRPAYVAYEASAPGAPPFVWRAPVGTAASSTGRPLRPSERARIGIDLDAWAKLRQHPLAELQARLRQSVALYLPAGVFAALFLLAVPALADRRLLVPAGAVGALAVATGVSSFFLPSYVAPAIAPLAVLVAVGASRVAAVGVPARRAVMAAAALLAVGGAWRVVHQSRDEAEHRSPASFPNRRAALARALEQEPGRQLVFVSYDHAYRSQHEFVQNSADRDSAAVLWAHDLGGVENERLMALERHRRPWILRVAPNAGGPGKGVSLILQRYGDAAATP